MTDPYPYIRLWQSVLTHAIWEASFPNPHRLEAQMFVESERFRQFCNFFNVNEKVIRDRLKEPGIYEKFRKARRTGAFKGG